VTLRALLALLLGLCLATGARAAALLGVSIEPGVVTIATDGPLASGWTLALNGPDRLVVDLPAVVAGPVTVAGVNSVERLRLAAFQPGVARLVMDLRAPVVLESAEAGERALVLRLRRASAEEFAGAVAGGRRVMAVRRAAAPLVIEGMGPKLPEAVVEAAASGRAVEPPMTRAGQGVPDATTPVQPRPVEAVRAPEPPRPEPVVRTGRSTGVKPRGGAVPLVVIDAGHGGKDVGAVSVRGGYEKDVTLAIARETARLLRARGRVRVRLTREDDRFIPLAGRVQIARDARADLFVSVHADAALNQEARGASVYTLSAVASDAVAAQLAARENKADIIGGVNLGIDAPEVGDVLIELSRRATTNVSVAFAEILQEELSSRIRFRSQFHHFAGFRVLKAPDVPSVLLETGYVSNGEDSDFLFSGEGQRRIADGIARAIERHLVGD
jgi:N-acetylmuramoyl-L-alanine amidase